MLQVTEALNELAGLVDTGDAPVADTPAPRATAADDPMAALAAGFEVVTIEDVKEDNHGDREMPARSGIGSFCIPNILSAGICPL